MEDFNKLIELTALIKSEELRKKTVDILNNSPEYFRTAASSSSGLHHPKSSLGIGGLVRHTITVVKLANYICDLRFLQITDQMKDKILAACFIHDTRKFGEFVHEGYTLTNHPTLASELVDDIEISQMVLRHMGQWSHFEPTNIHEFIVHLADYLASRKDIQVGD